MAYLVSYGMGSYFNQILEGFSYFTLHFDETKAAQVKKQMDLLYTIGQMQTIEWKLSI